MATTATVPSGEAGADVSFRGERRTYTLERLKIQAACAAGEGVSYHRVTGDLGPIHLLQDAMGNAPRVVLELHPDRAFVFVEFCPWGMRNTRVEFLNRNGPALPKYIDALRLQLRDAALGEEARRARIDAARKREVDAIRAEREARR